MVLSVDSHKKKIQRILSPTKARVEKAGEVYGYEGRNTLCKGFKRAAPTSGSASECLMPAVLVINSCEAFKIIPAVASSLVKINSFYTYFRFT